ncbi:hypothetical protein COLO4_00636, partial [Corchorus olitorius]
HRAGRAVAGGTVSPPLAAAARYAPARNADRPGVDRRLFAVLFPGDGGGRDARADRHHHGHPAYSDAVPGGAASAGQAVAGLNGRAGGADTAGVAQSGGVAAAAQRRAVCAGRAAVHDLRCHHAAAGDAASGAGAAAAVRREFTAVPAVAA